MGSLMSGLVHPPHRKWRFRSLPVRVFLPPWSSFLLFKYGKSWFSDPHQGFNYAGPFAGNRKQGFMGPEVLPSDRKWLFFEAKNWFVLLFLRFWAYIFHRGSWIEPCSKQRIKNVSRGTRRGQLWRFWVKNCWIITVFLVFWSLSAKSSGLAELSLTISPKNFPFYCL